MSYSLYLWHWSVLAIARWTIGVSPQTAPILLATMLVLAAMSYYAVERPLRHLSWAPNNIATLAISGILIAVSAGALYGLKGHRFGILFTGLPVDMAAKGVNSLRDDKWPAGHSGPRWSAKDCLLTSDADVGKKIDHRTCGIGDDSAVATRRFLVIGNSYSAATFEMFTDLAAKRLGVVTVTSSWGASAVPEILNTSPWSKANSYYWDVVVPKLISELSSGDIVIMANDIAELTPDKINDAASKKLGQLAIGLHRISHELQQKGVSIVFMAPLPFMRDAVCTPDNARPQWFNFGPRTGCIFYSRAYTLESRKPMMEIIGKVESSNSNFRVLDLLPLYCPGATCTFFSPEKVPLYRDVYSHPSVEASILARPFLLTAIQSLPPAATIDDTARMNSP